MTSVPKVVGFVVLIAFVWGSVGFVAAADRCVACVPCEDGACPEGREGSLTSHHHCCASSCLAHTSIVIPIAPFAAALPVAESMQPGVVLPALDRAPDTPYRPPRA